MARLILVPQYPAKLRYQEWWYWELPWRYSRFFDDVIVLGQSEEWRSAPAGYFSPVRQALEFEMQQVREYLDLEVLESDVLLLCDISFPGLFGQALFHKRPRHCFAVCHATSLNRHDYFASTRPAKWRVESGLARLLDRVFVATYYHKGKLGWQNAEVTGLPLPPATLQYLAKADGPRRRQVVSVARANRQKRNGRLEKLVEKHLGLRIVRPHCSTWKEYYAFLSESRVLLITAKEETFGYQVVDAILNGCIPVAPARFSYPELLPREYLYGNEEEMIGVVSAALEGRLGVPRLLVAERCAEFFERTARIMGECRDGK